MMTHDVGFPPIEFALLLRCVVVIKFSLKRVNVGIESLAPFGGCLGTSSEIQRATRDAADRVVAKFRS